MKYTNRGFAVYTELTDTYGNQVRVQKSSSFSKRCWIFVDNKDTEEEVRLKAPAAHLDSKQAIQIAKALVRFAKSNKDNIGG